MLSLAEDVKNFGLLLFYAVQTARSLLDAAAQTLFFIINLLLPILKTLFSAIPGLLKIVSFFIKTIMTVFHMAFTLILFVSAPVMSIGGYILGWILPTSVMHDFQSLFNTMTAWCSYATVYTVSLALLTLGSLIIVTEDPVPGRNQLRPRTTVPLVCLLAGLVLHYDKVQSNDWIAPSTLLTGALWYFVSLVYDDIACRERVQRRRDVHHMHRTASSSSSSSTQSLTTEGHLHPKRREITPLKMKRLHGDGAEGGRCCVIWPPSSPTRRASACAGACAGATGATGAGDYNDDDCDEYGCCDKSDCAGGSGNNNGQQLWVESVRLEKGCPICFVEFETDEVIRALTCSHSFHSECIGKWFAKSNRCPICWKPQTKYGQLVHALFE